MSFPTVIVFDREGKKIDRFGYGKKGAESVMERLMMALGREVGG